MTSPILPICFDCVHFHSNNVNLMTCDAFPEKIPVAIVDSEADHHDPYPGDHGIQFEKKPSAVVALKSYFGMDSGNV